MSLVYNPITGKLDVSQTTNSLDTRYVNVPGDTMVGNLDMQGNSILMTDNNNVSWRITINTDGVLITQSETGTIGQPIGFLLALTYSA